MVVLVPAPVQVVPAPALVVVADMNIWKQIRPGGMSRRGKASKSIQFDPPASGIYHYDYQDGEERSRIHLRIDGDLISGQGNGILLVNANRVIHLNPTATLMAHLYLEGKSDDKAVHIAELPRGNFIKILSYGMVVCFYLIKLLSILSVCMGSFCK